MMAAIRHRGPDSEGQVVRGAAGLGHRRLSIIDLSPAGHQPMRSGDHRYWIAFNGEIYNYADLKRELEGEGEPFCSSSDTEVLLRLYERMGVACLEKLEGMFAFAVWDDAHKTLFLARDRIGIKPLYYYLDDRWIVFASEIKAILQCPDVPREVNPGSLVTYFTFGHSFAPDTIFTGIHKLLPGHFMICSSAGTTVTRYWDIEEAPAHHDCEEEAAAKTRGLLERAVASHMVSDVPVGAFLSGGIDSSAVVAMMSRHSRLPVKTFSVGFDVGGHYNELEDARLIARRFRTEHHEKIVTGLDAEKLIERLVYHYDEPFADAANLPTFIISEFARQHVKVVLSGEGSDEIFGGYRRYYAQRDSRYFQLLPGLLRDRLCGVIAGKMRRFRRFHKALEMMRIPDEALRYAFWVAVFTEDAKAELFDRTLNIAREGFDAFRPYRQRYNRFTHWDVINRSLYTDLKGWLPDTYLEKLDKAAMAVGLEGRVPFLDHRLVEYAFRLPGRWKVKGHTTKYLLKKCLKGVLPESTIYKSKHGFAVPLDEWFRGRLKGFAAEVLLARDAKRPAYFRMKTIEKMMRQHVAGERDLGIQLWTLLNFELWHRRFMSQEYDAPLPPGEYRVAAAAGVAPHESAQRERATPKPLAGSATH